MKPQGLLEELDLNNLQLFEARPVFILGIAKHSGTTYLEDLLRLHPDCDVDGLELEEDHFVTYSDLLIKYVKLASKNWKLRRDLEQLQKERELVSRCLGDGLISYLKLQVKNRRMRLGIAPDKTLRVLLTKTPDVTNLDSFFTIFPDAHLLILIRDGRSVVESAMRIFHRSFADEAQRWAKRSADIQRFAKSDSNPRHKYLIVRYEDLYTKTEEELRRIMTFLRIDPVLYDFEAATDLPVRGTSALCCQEVGWQESCLMPGMHCNPMLKTQDLRSLERWSNWGRAKHERFNWIAGRCLAPFGYEMKFECGNRWSWTTWNIVLDVLLHIERTLQLFRKMWREQLDSNDSECERHLLSKFWSVIARSEAQQDSL